MDERLSKNLQIFEVKFAIESLEGINTFLGYDGKSQVCYNFVKK